MFSVVMTVIGCTVSLLVWRFVWLLSHVDSLYDKYARLHRALSREALVPHERYSAVFELWRWNYTTEVLGRIAGDCTIIFSECGAANPPTDGVCLWRGQKWFFYATGGTTYSVYACEGEGGPPSDMYKIGEFAASEARFLDGAPLLGVVIPVAVVEPIRPLPQPLYRRRRGLRF